MKIPALKELQKLCFFGNINIISKTVLSIYLVKTVLRMYALQGKVCVNKG